MLSNQSMPMNESIHPNAGGVGAGLEEPANGGKYGEKGPLKFLRTN